MNKIGSPPNPHLLKSQADKLRDQANGEPDPKRREQLRNLAGNLDDQHRRAFRPKA